MVTPGMPYEDLVGVVGWLTATMNGDRDGQASPANWVGYGGDAYTLTVRNDDPNARSVLWLDQDGTTIQLRSNVLGLYSDKGLTVLSLATGALTVTGTATIFTLVVTGPSSFAGAATFNGAVTLGNDAADPIVVNGTLTVQQPATFNDPVVFNDEVTFEGAVEFNDPVVFNDEATFNGPVTFGSLTVQDLTVTGNAALGNGDGDTHTVIGVTHYRNAANTATQLYVDAANNRVIVGNNSALGSDVTPNLQVIGRLYVAPATANDEAVQIRRDPSATVGWTYGVTSGGGLAFRDTTGAIVFQLDDSGGATQATVTDDLEVIGNVVCDFIEAEGGDLNGPIDLLSTGGTFDWQDSGNSRLKIDGTGVGFFGATTVGRPSVVGTLTAATLPQLTAVVASILAALDETELGLVTDLTT